MIKNIYYRVDVIGWNFIIYIYIYMGPINVCYALKVYINNLFLKKNYGE